MSKNILILSGSPRKGGNSDILCDEFMRGAQEAGHTAEKIFIREKKIGYGKFGAGFGKGFRFYEFGRVKKR